METVVQTPLTFVDIPYIFSKYFTERLHQIVLPPRLPRLVTGKQSACDIGVAGSLPRLGKSPGGGHGNPLPYSCLRDPMDRGAWRATVHRVTKNWTPLK